MSAGDYNQEIKVDVYILHHSTVTVLWQATVDEGGKLVNLSQDEIMCMCVKCVSVSLSVISKQRFHPATRSESYLIYSLFCTKNSFYNSHKINWGMSVFVWQHDDNVWSNTLVVLLIGVFPSAHSEVLSGV